MAVEDLKELQRQIESLYNAAESLKQAFPNDKRMDWTQMGIIKARLPNIYHWAQDLPVDEDRLALIRIDSLQGRCLSEIWCRFKAQAKRATHPLEVNALERLATQAFAVNQQLLNAIKGSPPLYERSFVTLSPAQAMQLLKVNLYPWYLSKPYPVPDHSEKMIIYHPYYTPVHVHGLVIGLIWLRVGPVRLSCRQTPPGFEMVLTCPRLHLRPDLWQVLTTRYPRNLEVLHDIGGTLDPLTWNTGQGEGVIVRLPWAKTS